MLTISCDNNTHMFDYLLVGEFLIAVFAFVKLVVVLCRLWYAHDIYIYTSSSRRVPYIYINFTQSLYLRHSFRNLFQLLFRVALYVASELGGKVDRIGIFVGEVQRVNPCPRSCSAHSVDSVLSYCVVCLSTNCLLHVTF